MATEQHDAAADEHGHDHQDGLTVCVNHPNRETGLRCNRCSDPICVSCAVRTPVGYRCPKCIRSQQATFYTGLPTDYVVAAVVSPPLAAAGAFIASLLGSSFFGLFLAFMIGSAAGALVSDVAWRAAGRRRSRYLWAVVCGGIIVGTLAVALFQGGNTITASDFIRLDLGIFVALAVSSAYGRLRLG
jgi:hypothetical protein